MMQKTELEVDFNWELLNIPGYVLEVENSLEKRRVGTYIKSNIKFVRRQDLEGVGNHLFILDITSNKKMKRVINIYRSFNTNGLTQR